MAKNKENPIEKIAETVHPLDAVQPIFGLVAEILASALTAVAKAIAIHFLLGEKKQIDTAICAKELKIPYGQCHLACKDLARAGLLAPVAADVWAVKNPFDLRVLVDNCVKEKLAAKEVCSE